ncbi:MAG: DUF4367 domain-containing protein [Eubacteriales bacterium]|nr:DUF4367 domain-containing protein [Eubacteriales bacterium]
MNEKEIKKGLRSDIVLSEQVETKIQGAYQKVREESMRKKSEQPDFTFIKRRKRRFAVIAAAAMLVMGTTIGTVASNQFFSFTKNDEEILGVFNLEGYEPCYDIFDLEVTYLPEGYEEVGGKYRKDGPKPGIESVITPFVENTAVWASKNGGVTEIWNVETIEETTINGMDAYIFTKKASHGSYFNPMFLFNMEEGYVISLFTTDDISTDEAKKIAEGLKVTNTGEKEYGWEQHQYETKDLIQMIAYNVDSVETEEGEALSNGDVLPEGSILKLQEPFCAKVEEGEIEFTVESAKYVASCKEYDPQFFVNYEEEVLPYLNEDGTVKPYWRQPVYEGENPDSSDEEQAEQIFLEVKMRAKNISEKDLYSPFYFGMQSLEKVGEEYRMPRTTYYPVADYILNEFQVYFDARQNFEGITGQKQALWRNIKADEELNFTMLFLVDKDQMDRTYLRIPAEYMEGNQYFVDLGLSK